MHEGSGSKKMLNMLILEILKKYSDTDHCLSQQDIIKYLLSDYGIKCDRRSVKNNIDYLYDSGFDIAMDRGYSLLTREFDDTELQILIKSIAFTKSISRKTAETIIKKLQSMGSVYFKPGYTKTENFLDFDKTENKYVMINLDILDRAIEEGKKVSFIYNSYGPDKKLCPRREEPFIFNPYRIIVSNQRYYLVGNYDKYDNLSHFRIDKMTKMQLLNEKAKDRKKVLGMENGLNIPKHLHEHAYMFSGEAEMIIMKYPLKYMDDLVDWFGQDFHIMKNDGETLEIHLKSGLKAMECWALQYGLKAEIISPVSLREKMKEDAEKILEKYR